MNTSRTSVELEAALNLDSIHSYRGDIIINIDCIHLLFGLREHRRGEIVSSLIEQQEQESGAELINLGIDIYFYFWIGASSPIIYTI